MKQFEYNTKIIVPEEIYTELTDLGILGWELVFITTLQYFKPPDEKVIQIGQPKQPEIVTKFQLILKREKCKE